MSGFEALAAFEPLARLTKRDETLDGSVPLRVAQACVPLLEGNAFGHQIVFARQLVVRSALARRGLEPTRELEEIDRAHRAAVPFLVAQGFLRSGGAWDAQLRKKWWWIERGVLRVWTGLLVRPRSGTWLRVSGAGSRAILGLSVRTTWIAETDELVPLVIDIEAANDKTRLEGEVATIAAVVPDVRVAIDPIAVHRGLVDAHVAFYDAKYFATKRGDVTKKYRRTVSHARARANEHEAGAPATLRVAHVAGPRPEVVTIDRVLGTEATSPLPLARGRRGLQVVRFFNAVPFTAHFDGNTLAVEPDRKVLERGADVVRAEIAKVLGEGAEVVHKGAVLYLTKYFTPHPNGEPHFFVKPWAFTSTSPGWSSVIEGVRGDGWDVMRGVVWTDRFHATPAVFAMQPNRRVRIAEGAPLLDVVAVPRSLLDEGFTLQKEG
ncbi:MAG: hypothetical protein JWP87_1709 [Labilithrix sp.]|nr:hypothetical protein [Labilithrix sp.]